MVDAGGTTEDLEFAARRLCAAKVDDGLEVIAVLLASEQLSPSAQATASCLRAKLWQESRGARAGVAELEQGLEAYAPEEHDAERLSVLCTLASLLLARDLAAAEARAREAEALAERIGDPQARAEARRILAISLRARVGAHGQAEKLRRLSFQDIGEGTLALAIEVDRALDGHQRATEAERRALLARVDEVDDRIAQSDMLSRLCVELPDSHGRLAEQLEVIAGQGARRSEAKLRTALAQLYLGEGRPRDAREQAEHALALVDELGDLDLLARAHACLAANSRMLDRDQRARHFDASLAASQRLGDQATEATVLLNEALLALDSGDREGARELAKQAVKGDTISDQQRVVGMAEALLGSTTWALAERRLHRQRARNALLCFGLGLHDVDRMTPTLLPVHPAAVITVLASLAYLIYLIVR